MLRHPKKLWLLSLNHNNCICFNINVNMKCLQEAEDLQQQLKEKANKLYTTVGENDAESSISSNNLSTLSVLNESIEKR